MSEENIPLPSVEDMPVLRDAAEGMQLDLIVGDRGEVYILHAKPLPEPVNWVEYDREVLKLYLISDKGRIQGVGLKVKKRLDEIISAARQVCLIHCKNGDIVHAYEMPLVHQVK
ncbi:MAG: hypothetical protein OEY94_00415 [Alphaproteobacteria bacterium]|nr:hypothetical protein [Alphaproteobacteria bacterium]